MKTAKQLLNKLIDQYENSVVSKSGSQRNLRQKITFQPKLLPRYYASDGYQFKKELNEALFVMQARGWIDVVYEEEYDEILEIVLLYPHLDEIYVELKRTSRQSYEKQLLALFYQYEKEYELVPYVSDMINRIQNYQVYKSFVCEGIDKTECLLKALLALLRQKEEVSERIFSVRVLNDSKLFTTLKSKLVMILKTYYGADDEDVDQVLSEYNVFKNPNFLYLKGQGSFQIGSTIIHLDDFKNGFALSSSDVEVMKWLSLDVNRVVSIENLTSFHVCDLDDTLFVYLGGFHNRLRRQLFLKLKEVVNVPFYHFGDIDVGGFRIHRHLCDKTGIDFIPLCMDVDTISTYENVTLSLSKEDIKALELCLKQNPPYCDVMQWMLHHRKKLEQEHVELHISMFDKYEKE